MLSSLFSAARLPYVLSGVFLFAGFKGEPAASLDQFCAQLGAHAVQRFFQPVLSVPVILIK